MMTAKVKENEGWLQQYVILIEDTMMLFRETPLYQKSEEIFRELSPRIKDYLKNHQIIKVSYIAFGLLRTSFFFLNEEDGGVTVMSLSVENNQPTMKDISYVDFYLAVAHVQRFFRYKTDNLLPCEFTNIIDAVNCYVADKVAEQAERQMKQLHINNTENGTDEKPIDEVGVTADTSASDSIPKPVFTSKYKT